MRKSFDGLLALAKQVFRDQDPYSGCWFLFVNRRGNYVKILTWDRMGVALLAKRLERSRFAFPDNRVIDASEAVQDVPAFPCARTSR